MVFLLLLYFKYQLLVDRENVKQYRFSLDSGKFAKNFLFLLL